jgi:hypothetical protein
MIKSFFIILVVSWMPSLFAAAQSPWELRKDKDNIRIYSRSVTGCKFNELKAVFDLQGTLGQLRSVLSDVNNYKDWVYSTEFTKLIENRNDTEIVYYSRIAAPWPVSNRDFYSDTHIRMDPDNLQMHISSRNIENEPLSNHLVRIPFLRAEWAIRALSPNIVHVEYTLAWNPGGSIAGWVANLFSTTGPYQSFSELKRKMTLLNSSLSAK